jgi:RimJ/RimL family protein N-acetyltransferase
VTPVINQIGPLSEGASEGLVSGSVRGLRMADMENMPYRDRDVTAGALPILPPVRPLVSGVSWRRALPALTGEMATLRELRTSDAAALLAMLSTQEVSRFISPPPTTVRGFERFIAWARGERAAGRYACFAVVPHGTDTAVGIFQIRQTEPGFETAEWGVALGSAFWGSGLFVDGATLVIDFAFDVIGCHRLEARAAVANGRGNGALRKIGAVQEGVLRRSFLRRAEYLDQALWTILDDDWRGRSGWGRHLH